MLKIINFSPPCRYIQRNMIMIEISSFSSRLFLRASSTTIQHSYCFDQLSSYGCFFIKFMIYFIVKESKRPSEPKTMNSPSKDRQWLWISGQLVTPYRLAAFSPNDLETAMPGPQGFLPGAQILRGPENFPLEVSSFLTTPPAS